MGVTGDLVPAVVGDVLVDWLKDGTGVTGRVANSLLY